MKGSLRGSFHGNRGNSFRGGSIRGRRGSKRGSFRVPKPGMSPGGKVSPSNFMKPKVETRLDISLFYQVGSYTGAVYITLHTSLVHRLFPGGREKSLGTRLCTYLPVLCSLYSHCVCVHTV